MIKTQNYFFQRVVGVALFFIKAYSLVAVERVVNITNKTKKSRPQQIEMLNLIHLKDGMQIIQSFAQAGPTLDIVIPENKSGFPYMLQGVYQGVKYNQVIPPALSSNQPIGLKVYEKSNQYNDIHLRVLYVVRYVGKNLRFLVLYKFINQSQYTFVEKKNGIYFFIPPKSDRVNVSVSVGSGLSNIQWLKMVTEPVENKKNIFAIPYPLKPGERIYQIGYQIPYDRSSSSHPIRLIYPVADKVEVLLETKGLNLTIRERPNWFPKVESNEKVSTLSGNLITLPHFSNTLNLVFQGGQPSQEDHSQDTDAQSVLILSPLNKVEAIIYPVFSILLLLVIFIYLERKPLWLVKMWLKQKSLLEYQLISLQTNQKPEYIELTDTLKKQLTALEKKIRGVG